VKVNVGNTIKLKDYWHLAGLLPSFQGLAGCRYLDESLDRKWIKISFRAKQNPLSNEIIYEWCNH